MKPWGRFHATDVYRAGGVALVARELAKRRARRTADAPTVDGQDARGRRGRRRQERPGQEVVRPIEQPIKPTRQPPRSCAATSRPRAASSS